jgi:hypothetical protein
MSAEDMDVPDMEANDGMDATSNILAGAGARTPAMIPSANTARSPSRSPSRIPARSPVRRADGFEIVCTADLTLAIGQEEEEVEVAVSEREDGYDISDDSSNDDDGVAKYMLCLDRHLGLLEKAHVLEGERELGDGGDYDKEGEEVLIHDEAKVESTEERHEATDANHNLEDKDDNAVILARNNTNMAVDPRMRLPEPLPEWVPPLPKVDKGEPMFSDVENPGNWLTFTANMEKG